MEIARGDNEEDETPDQNQNQKQNQSKPQKGKSCKGCLYYSSALKSKSRNPLCVGISRSVQVHGYVVGESEVEAAKEGRNFLDFQYGCLGYSMFLSDKDSSKSTQDTRADLPACIGIEVFLVDKKVPAASDLPGHVTAPVHNKEDGDQVVPASRTPKPASPRDDFQTRFTRNAGVVASGVANNLIKVSNRVKENLEDMLYPYRRKP